MKQTSSKPEHRHAVPGAPSSSSEGAVQTESCGQPYERPAGLDCAQADIAALPFSFCWTSCHTARTNQQKQGQLLSHATCDR